MAAGIISKPGTQFGPCFQSGCQHTDCNHSRKMAVTQCRLCLETIGYETRYYNDDTYGLVHAACLEDLADKVKLAQQQQP